jgi:ribosomal protein L3
VYGVRKTDHEWVSKQKNWVNIQTHIKKELSKCEAELVNHFAINELDLSSVFHYNISIVEKVTDANSDYVKFVTQSKGVVKNGSVSRHSFEKLYRDYSSNKVLKFDDAVANLRAQRNEIMEKYPLLSSISSRDVSSDAVAQYINLIDKEVK